jgi:hypothetical protein
MFKALGQRFILSLYSRNFYLGLLADKLRFFDFVYIIFVATILACFAAIFLYNKLLDVEGNEIRTVIDQFPTLTVADNDTFTFANNQPKDVQIFEDENGLRYSYVLSTSGEPIVLFNIENAKVPAKLLPKENINKQSVYFYLVVYKDHISLFNGVIEQSYWLKDIHLAKNTVISADSVYSSVSSYIKNFGFWLVLLCSIVFFVIRHVFNTIFTVFLSLIVARLQGSKLPMQAVIRVNIYANSVYVIIGLLGILCMEYEFSQMILNNWLISMLPILYLYLMIKFLRQQIGKQILDSADNNGKNGVFRA